MSRFLALALVFAAVCVGYWTYAHREERARRVAASRSDAPRARALARDVPRSGANAKDAEAEVEAAPLASEPPPPGAVRRIELMEPPAMQYASPPAHDEAALNYKTVLAELRARGAEYDPLLGRAAREVAFQHSFYDGTLPRAVLQFLLRSAGALDRSVLEGFTATNAKGPEAIRERALQLVERALESARGAPIRVGVGEAFVPGAQFPRFIAVLVSRRAVEVDPTPARVRLGETWVLRAACLPRRGARAHWS